MRTSSTSPIWIVTVAPPATDSSDRRSVVSTRITLAEEWSAGGPTRRTAEVEREAEEVAVEGQRSGWVADAQHRDRGGGPAWVVDIRAVEQEAWDDPAAALPLDAGGQDVPVVEAELPRHDLQALAVRKVDLPADAQLAAQGLGHLLGLAERTHD
ncbi:hypothetical protein GCM10009687_20730 [Asanoa iriomotensis]|uniref:Uncharacterized protein n=1 Tax=Asanoa iriomotensis TaxID=234613 RepID=A0ABQ4C1W0_9ACTN|nr:hypothetical protein Air01nite_28550 [Asanoa iriomotensis]